ncbi:hypothetical protein JL721_11640 [Aureococcus anophagefferens]|nr:hypothetical protein JL721_11640 [Aureococcus anophagefferens]
MRASASAPALHDAGSKHVDGRARRVRLAGGAAPSRARRGSVGLAGAPTAGHARRGSIGVPGASEGEAGASPWSRASTTRPALRAPRSRRKSVVEDFGRAAARQLGEERGVGTARTFGTFSRGGRYGKGGWGAEAVARSRFGSSALFQLKAPADAAFQVGTCFVHVDGGDDGSVAAETLRRLRDQPSRVQDRRDDLDAAAAAKREARRAAASAATGAARRPSRPAWLRLAALGARCRVAGTEMEADRKLALDPSGATTTTTPATRPSRPRALRGAPRNRRGSLAPEQPQRDTPMQRRRSRASFSSTDGSPPPLLRRRSSFGEQARRHSVAHRHRRKTQHLVFTEAATKIKRWWIAERYRRFARELGAQRLQWFEGTMRRYITRIHHRYKLAKRAVSADVVAEFLRGAAVSGKPPRASPSSSGPSSARRRYRDELGLMRKHRQSVAMRHMAKDPRLGGGPSLEAANTKLAKLLSLNGNGVTAKRLRRRANRDTAKKCGAEHDEDGRASRESGSSGRASPEGTHRCLALLHVNKHLGGDAVPEKDAYDYAPWRRADRRAYVERLLVAQRTAHQGAAYASYYAFLNNAHRAARQRCQARRRRSSAVF